MSSMKSYDFSSVKDRNGNVLFSFHYTENDGQRLKKRGFETCLNLNFGSSTIDDVLTVLPTLEMDVYMVISEMVKKGTLVSGSYKLPEPDWYRRR